MAAEMVGMVGSALAQEGVSGASSYISGKLEEKASRAHNIARLEMALSQLEFALESASKLPITYVSLLRRMKVLKRAYLQGKELLNKQKKMVENQDEGRQPATTTRLTFLDGIFRCAASLVSLPVSSLVVGLRKERECQLTSSIAQRYEWYAACADKFVADVESGCPLRRDDHSFRYPLLRHLLQGKTLCYETVKGRQHYSLHVWPVRLETRGVEGRLLYQYLDRETPEKRFRLRLVLRLSEDTDIVGIAIKCLQSLTSQFKLVTASAAGELATLPYNLQDDIAQQSYGPPLDWSEETYVGLTNSWRPDPICCAGDNVVSPHGVPEPVIAVGFACYVSAPVYNDNLHGSSSGDNVIVVQGRNARQPPPLFLVAAFVPHHHHHTGGAARGLVLSYGGNEECLGGDSILQVQEVLRSKAIVDCVVGQPEPMDYVVSYYAPHGFARVTLRKASNELEWKGTRSGNGAAAKRKRSM